MPEITVFAVIFKVFTFKCRKLRVVHVAALKKKMHQRQYFITKVYSKQIKTPFFDENGQGGDDDKQGSKILSIIMITAVYTGCPNKFGIMF